MARYQLVVERHPAVQIYDPQSQIEEYTFPNPGSGRGTMVESLPPITDEIREQFRNHLNDGLRPWQELVAFAREQDGQCKVLDGCVFPVDAQIGGDWGYYFTDEPCSFDYRGNGFTKPTKAEMLEEFDEDDLDGLGDFE